MNITVTFHIEVRQAKQRFRMLVEHYYSSPQVDRFRILGRGRELLVEKRLQGRTWCWKITQSQIRAGNMHAADALRDMLRAMDRYLKQRARDRGPDEGYVEMK